MYTYERVKLAENEGEKNDAYLGDTFEDHIRLKDFIDVLLHAISPVYHFVSVGSHFESFSVFLVAYNRYICHRDLSDRLKSSRAHDEMMMVGEQTSEYATTTTTTTTTTEKHAVK